jgi:hypothetical protein
VQPFCPPITCRTLWYDYVCTRVGRVAFGFGFLGVLDRFSGCFGLDILVSGCVSAAIFWHLGAPLSVAHVRNVVLYVCLYCFLGVLDRFGGCFGLDILVSGCVSAASFWHLGAPPLPVAHLPNVVLGLCLYSCRSCCIWVWFFGGVGPFCDLMVKG